jgi:methionyl-tRNA synthetase
LPIIEEKDEFLEMLNALCEGFVLLEAGHKIGEANHLFTRIDDDVIHKQMDKLKANDKKQEEKAETETKTEIAFDDFTKLDIRTATITAAEAVKKADKLLKLEVDLGYEQRTVVSGIAEFFKPEEIVGKQVSLLTNLAPRKIRGVLSQGMILMSEDKNGKLAFVSPPENWPNGSTIR